jgi:hypothetical protein
MENVAKKSFLASLCANKIAQSDDKHDTELQSRISLLCCCCSLSACSVFEEDATIERAVFGADTALASWSGWALVAGSSGLAVLSAWARGSGWATLTSVAVSTVASRGTSITSITRWSRLSGAAAISGGWWGRLGWSAGLASRSIGSGLAVGTRWAGGSLRSGWSIVALTSGLSWATGGSWFSGAAGWSGLARWAGVARWLLGLLANSWWAAGEARGTGNTGATGLSVETGLAFGSRGSGQAAAFATSLTLLTSGVASGVADRGSGAVFVHLHHDVAGRHLAELHLVVDLGVHMVHVVVDHGQRDEHGQDRHQREGDCRIGNEAVGLLTSV